MDSMAAMLSRAVSLKLDKSSLYYIMGRNRLYSMIQKYDHDTLLEIVSKSTITWY
jgi:hypothetical protein